jgi:NDP-sugar pyrophosphorylase family protein
MKVAILAGGLGTRLGTITRGLPKSMVTVAGKPFLEHIVASFAACGFREFLLLIGHHGDVIEAHFGHGRHDLRFEYSRERDLRGTGGAVRDAEHLLSERFILTYGDVLRRFDYDRFVNEHPDHALAVYPRLTTGNTDVEQGRVTDFRKDATSLPYVDAGFAVVRRDAIALLPPHGVCSFEDVVYSRLAAENQLAAEIVDHRFYDIGTPDELARTRKALEG